MELNIQAMPGYFPIAPNKTVVLEPRSCGSLKVGSGAVAIDDRVLTRGTQVRLWAGDRVEMSNIADRTTLYAWDLCARQPKLRFRIRSAAKRWWRAVTFDRVRPLRECARDLWCVSR
jgi:hypothetical protein